MRVDTPREIFDRRLRSDSRRPVAVALSGGGDSLALLLLADAWARDVGRTLLVLTVDHGVQPQSRAWTETCAAVAARLGLAFRVLPWVGEKPATGLSAAARTARHALLADAAREAGARVILMGHTADDIAEARLMRVRGATTPEPREWAPSPAWPQGRDVFLLRPLLNQRRADLRGWLTARGEIWIDDPANESLTSIRAQARRDIAGRASWLIAPASTALRPALALACSEDRGAGLSIARDTLMSAPPDPRGRFLSAACVCAAGGTRVPPRAAVLRLAERLAGGEPVTATLAGARIEADADRIHILREPGEAARGGLQPLSLAAGETAVWDGRFEIMSSHAMRIRPARGLRARLDPRARAALASLPPRARDTAPVIESSCGVMLAAARPLTLARLHAACGVVQQEPV